MVQAVRKAVIEAKIALSTAEAAKLDVLLPSGKTLCAGDYAGAV